MSSVSLVGCSHGFRVALDFLMVKTEKEPHNKRGASPSASSILSKQRSDIFSVQSEQARLIRSYAYLLMIVITLSLFAGSRTAQRSIFTHSISHCQPRNRVPQTLTAAIRHVYNLFSVDHKVPDVDTGYHRIFTISLISFIQVCDCEDSAACAQESRKCDLKARIWNA